MSRIIIFTDGACSKNPGPGGWAAIFNHDTKYEVLSGYEIETTNNRMELLAVVKGINKAIKEGYDNIIINSDSAYVINSINKKWIHKWKAQGWRKGTGEKVKNSDLWRKIDVLLKTQDIIITFQHVRGHNGNTFNELADEYAKRAVEHAKLMAL